MPEDSAPRILLLAWQGPDGRYAGAEAIRKVVAELPPARVRWAHLGPPARLPADHFPECAGFEPKHLHWRLRDTGWRYLYEQHWQAEALARRIAAWAEPFQPQRLWVLAEMGALTVGARLGARLRIPIHATVHDAYEFARLALPRWYYPLYRRSAMRLLRECASFDAISPELIGCLEESCPPLAAKPSLAFPSSIRRADMRSDVPPADDGAQAVRRIGLCGSMRTEEWQWAAFLTLLASLPWPFEILAFAAKEGFFSTPLPGNVRLLFQPYAETEATLVRLLASAGVWACYLGVSRKPDDAVFGRYSLSSKLTAYAAAGLPSIVDAPDESAVWRRVEAYDAGVLCDGRDDGRRGVRELMADAGLRRRLGTGALRLCRTEMDLERNVNRFTDVLSGENAGHRE